MAEEREPSQVAGATGEAKAEGKPERPPEAAAEAKPSPGRAAAERVLRSFTLDAVAPRYVELYGRLVDGGAL